MIGIPFPDDEACPDCGCKVFRGGPRGGISQNIECAQCKARFNVTRWDRNIGDHHQREGPMPIVWAHRIPSEAEGGGEWREDMFPKVCQ
jgi:hypothetical protein